jgi:ribokinase
MIPSRILVVGSANMDLVVKAPRMPVAGETVVGGEFSTVRGGKGANQAVACARLGADTWMLGCVGHDAFGEQLAAGLAGDGVHCDYLRRHETAPSGTAIIIIDATGENSIVVAPGANMEVAPEDIATVADLNGFDAILLQLEVPMPVVAAAVAAGRAAGVLSVLDAGPPNVLPQEVLSGVDVLSPNETEARAILGEAVDATMASEEIADRLIAAGARSVVLKLGAEGALVAMPEALERVKAFPVEPVDTTGAGDAFTAALAVTLAEGHDIIWAATVGAAAGALAATVFGAAPSMPTREKVGRFLKERGAASRWN